MKAFVAICALMILTACSSVSNVSYPLGDGTFYNQRTISDPHAFSPTTQRSWMEVCGSKNGQNGAKNAEPDYTNCYNPSDLRYAVNAGYMDGFAGAAVTAGAIAYAGHEIGRGLGKSGSTTQVQQDGQTTTTTQSPSISNSAIGRQRNQ